MNDDLKQLIYHLCDVTIRQYSCRLEALAKDDDAECRKHLSEQFPIIQGTKLQQTLRKLGNRASNKEAANRAIERLTEEASMQELADSEQEWVWATSENRISSKGDPSQGNE